VTLIPHLPWPVLVAYAAVLGVLILVIDSVVIVALVMGVTLAALWTWADHRQRSQSSERRENEL
jgi:hypothetical protein